MSKHPWPDAANKTPVVRPGSTSGGKTLSRYRWARKQRSADVVEGGAALMWFTIAMTQEAVVRTIFLGITVGSLLLLLITTALSGRALARFYSRIASGDIALIDDHLIAVWDELCQEQDLELSEGERQTEMYKLLPAQNDLHEELAQRTKVLNDVDRAEQLLLHDARIRARLLQEVERVKIEQAERARMDLLVAPPADPDWVSAEEVEDQLRILRQRRTAVSKKGADLAADAETTSNSVGDDKVTSASQVSAPRVSQSERQ